jgi:hypothetical protein
MHSIQIIVLVAFLLVSGGCSKETKPATPLETFQTYTKAVKQKDTTTMKLLLSNESLKMHEQQAKSQNTTVDEIVKRESLFDETQKRVEYRNEKIDGDKATIEIKNSFGVWETIPFLFEDSQWKIDKKGYAERLTFDIEEQNRQMDDMINSGRIGTEDPVPQIETTNTNSNIQN